ncbi:helix-turn-helix domain-containing protein [Rhodococcus sp. NPDC057529]|uniref:helix-turn-helix domain-containing protein n=1 Tax=Rhodococcus sp. NPDC057529 TaxID=3346158 RepID=UPI00366C4341
MARKFSPSEWIGRLKERGFSRKEIGEKIGKSSAYVGKVERGEVSGRTVESELRKVGRSRAKPEAVKAVQREERSALPRQRNTYQETPGGFVAQTHAGAPLLNALRRAANRGLTVSLLVTFAKASKYGRPAEADSRVRMYDHGIKAADLLRTIGDDNPAQVLTDIALSMQQHGRTILTDAEGLGGISLTATNLGGNDGLL